MIAYVEQHQIDISSWDLNHFKSALDFYLNTKFDMNNLFTFTKFYTYFHTCKLRNA